MMEGFESQEEQDAYQRAIWADGKLLPVTECERLYRMWMAGRDWARQQPGASSAAALRKILSALVENDGRSVWQHETTGRYQIGASPKLWAAIKAALAEPAP